MTTSTQPNGTSSTGNDAPGGLVEATITSVPVLWVVTSTALLYFDNLYGPFDEHGSLGALTALACGTGAGAVAFVLARAVARRSRVLLIGLLGVTCVAGWLLLPRQIDVSESWVPRPNPRWSCTGWSFQHYSPGVQDGSATRYCVGLEKRIANG